MRVTNDMHAVKLEANPVVELFIVPVTGTEVLNFHFHYHITVK